MPIPTMQIDDRELRRLIASGKRLGVTATMRLRQTADAVGLKLMGRAEAKAPVGETGILQGSGETTTRTEAGGLAVTVTFGGMASKYAEVQHENPNYTHTVEAWVAKYGTAQGARSSLKTGRTSYRNTSGGALKLKGHHGGQAHFLWGAENSAYDTWFQRWSEGVLQRDLTRIAGEVLGSG